jgi:hypothetical protein
MPVVHEKVNSPLRILSSSPGVGGMMIEGDMPA